MHRKPCHQLHVTKLFQVFENQLLIFFVELWARSFPDPATNSSAIIKSDDPAVFKLHIYRQTTNALFEHLRRHLCNGLWILSHSLLLLRLLHHHGVGNSCLFTSLGHALLHDSIGDSGLLPLRAGSSWCGCVLKHSRSLHQGLKSGGDVLHDQPVGVVVDLAGLFKTLSVNHLTNPVA